MSLNSLLTSLHVSISLGSSKRRMRSTSSRGRDSEILTGAGMSSSAMVRGPGRVRVWVLWSSRTSVESQILVHHPCCGRSIRIKQHGPLTFVKIRSLKDNCEIVSIEAFGKHVCLPYSSTVFVYNRAMLINVVYSSFWKFFRWLYDHNRWVDSSKNVHAAIDCTRHHRVLAQPWLSGSGKVQLGFQTWIQNHGLPDSGFRH